MDRRFQSLKLERAPPLHSLSAVRQVRLSSAGSLEAESFSSLPVTG